MEMAGSRTGAVACGVWIKRPENVSVVVLGRAANRRDSSSAAIEIFSYDPRTISLSSDPLAVHLLRESDGDPLAIAVHPSGDAFVCSTSKGGCKLFEVYGAERNLILSAKELAALKDVGPQKCLAFSFDGSRFAAGGVDGCLKILEWPNLGIILDESKAHKSFQDMDFSLDSAFLATTSTDGSARIWNAEDGVPVATLSRNTNEYIDLCRFSMDGTKPFLFCAARKGDQAVVNVYDIVSWNKIGYKRLIRKPASMMAVSRDGKYMALGSKDGDVSVVEVRKMDIYHYMRRQHAGTPIAALEFCPNQRVVLTTSSEWGAMVTKVNVPADWKDWQIYTLLLGLFLVSVIACYIFYLNSDTFWKFPLGKDQPMPKTYLFRSSKSADDQNMFVDPFGPVDM